MYFAVAEYMKFEKCKYYLILQDIASTVYVVYWQAYLIVTFEDVQISFQYYKIL
jgi:hypothetical protein